MPLFANYSSFYKERSTFQNCEPCFIDYIGEYQVVAVLSIPALGAFRHYRCSPRNAMTSADSAVSTTRHLKENRSIQV